MFLWAMMLDWLGEREGIVEGRSAAELIRRAVESASRVVRPMEVGGDAGTAAITKTVLEALSSLSLERSDANWSLPVAKFRKLP